MKKVYCKDCKYNSRWVNQCLYFNDIRNPFNGEIDEGKSPTYNEKYKGLNRSGKCPYYQRKRKWWKFWKELII